ncbi:MAG TPA: hypothetical protein PKD72_02620, partial [Gemmatales bacterium]|nr:hypothetical protein [Gemmatales bacterium]
HVVFMNYVLAGTLWLALHRLFARDSTPHASAKILTDWMPLMLSGAITAGIAPLLFLQLLYKQPFYTANLLLFHRWMAILPVLIIGFYGLYLLKTNWFQRQPRYLQRFLTFLPMLCIAFTGYSWTENHLLSLQSQSTWGAFYAQGGQHYAEPALGPRLLIWTLGAFPTLAVLLGWQHWYRGTGQPWPLARMAGLGMVLTLAACFWFWTVAAEHSRQALLSPLALPYLLTASLGILLQAIAWGIQVGYQTLQRLPLVLSSLGLLMTLLGMTVVREALRLHALGPGRLEQLYPLHAGVYGKGGFPLFLFFFVINSLLVAYVFWLVRQRSRESPPGLATSKTSEN